jgi:ubiquinone/menaquinone biosynthesis C-methylase UbiE
MFDNWDIIDRTGQAGILGKYLTESRQQFQDAARKSPNFYYSWLKLRPGVNILDVGCGNGFDVENLLASGYQVTGVDKSFDIMPHNKDNPRLKDNYTQVDIYSLSKVLSVNYDRVFANTLFQHLTFIEAALDEMIRVTKKDGLVAVSDTDWMSFKVTNSPQHTTLYQHAIYHNVKQADLGATLPLLFYNNKKLAGVESDKVKRTFSIGMFECSLDTIRIGGWRQ